MKRLYVKPQIATIVSSTLMTEGHLTTVSGGAATMPAQGRQFSESWDFMPSEAANEELLQ